MTDYLWSMVERLDARPWSADVRGPGSLRGGVNLPERDEDLLFYGIPDRYDFELLRTYNGGTNPPEPISVVEDTSGLILQTESEIYSLSEGTYEVLDVTPQDSLGEGRVLLCSFDRNLWDFLPGRPYREMPIDVVLEGLDLKLGGAGNYRVLVRYVATATVTPGQDLSTLPDYVEPAHLYVDDVRTEYTMTGTVISFTGTTGTLYYEAEQVFSDKSAPGTDQHRISLLPIADRMYRLPDTRRMEAVALKDTLCIVPQYRALEVDSEGFVGDIAVGHPITGVLPAEDVVLVCGGDMISLVHPQEGVLRQAALEGVLGLTWTPEGELGAVVKRTDTATYYDVYRIVEIYNAQSGGYGR